MSRRKKSIEDQIRKILKTPFWLNTLKSDMAYMRLRDDHDGEFEGILSVCFTQDGDAWVSTGRGELRFRHHFGGGQSPRTRTALLILAEAIRLDNEDHPIDIPIDHPTQL